MVDPKFVDVDGLLNLRDVGGYEAADGRTRCGLVYRSDSLHNATAAGVARLRGLDIVSVLDLRSPEEVGLLPGPLPIVHHPIQDDLERDGIDPRTLTGRAAGERLLQDLYVLLLAAAAPRCGAVLTTLSDAALLPAVVHCAGGKDRTGLAVALLLSVLGVDRETILDDYAAPMPGESAAARRGEVHAQFLELGIDEGVAWGMLSTPRWAMAAALSGLDDEYGSVEGYLRRACGVSTATFDALREVLVEPT